MRQYDSDWSRNLTRIRKDDFNQTTIPYTCVFFSLLNRLIDAARIIPCRSLSVCPRYPLRLLFLAKNIYRISCLRYLSYIIYLVSAKRLFADFSAPPNLKGSLSYRTRKEREGPTKISPTAETGWSLPFPPCRWPSSHIGHKPLRYLTVLVPYLGQATVR